MERFSDDRESLDFVVSRIALEAQRDGAPLSEIERKMLYFSETAWTLPDIVDVNDEFDRKYDQQEYEKKIAQLISKAVKRVRKQQPEEFEAWIQAIRVLRKEDRYLLVMVDQAKVGSIFRPSRPPGDLWKLWGTGIAVVGLFSGLVRFINTLATNKTLGPHNGDLVAFAFWVAIVGTALLGSVLRFFIGARRFDDMTSRALEWLFGNSQNGRNTSSR
jgi:hypothetical protein